MPDQRASMDQVSQYWDAFVLGESRAASDLEPGLASTIRHIHELGATPSTSARERVWQKVRANVEDARHLEGDPMLHALAPGQSQFPMPVVGLSGRVPEGTRRQDWAIGQLATVALLVLTLIGSLLAFGPGRLGRPQETQVSIPAIVTAPATPEAEQPVVAALEWETKGGPDLPLGLPGSLALDPTGNLWVTDSVNNRFQIFSPDGEFLEAWGETGSRGGQFEFERNLYSGGAIAFAPDGGFYVVDTGNLRIQRFAPDRAFITAWGSEGTGPGQFKWPSGIDIDDQGLVYVTDDLRNDVQVFDANGAHLRTIGEYGFGDGQFFFSMGSSVYVDAAGTLWVSDGSNHRIQTFSPEGELRTVLRGGTGKDQLGQPAQIAIDPEGRVFVAAPELREVRVFAPDGSFVASWGDPGAAAWAEADLPPGKFLNPAGLVLDNLGNVYVSDADGERVQKFRLLPPLSPAVTTVATPVANAPVAEFLWQSEGDPDLPLADPTRLAIDPQGNIWVNDGRNSRFQVFAPDGTFLEAWGAPGKGVGQFDFVEPTLFGGYGAGAMAFDDAGNLFVVDPGNYRVQKFGPDRSLVTTWGSFGLGEGQFAAMTDVAIDGQGRVYVTDESRGDIQAFDDEGRFLAIWSDTAEDWLAKPSGITIDADGNIWTAHFQLHGVQKHSPDGHLLAGWGEYGFEPGEFSNPSDVSVDSQGRVYVAEWGSNRMQVFDGEGRFLATWGSVGLDEGQLMGLNGSVLDGAGNIYVVEDGSDRIQKFRLMPPLAPE